jgi:peptidoglycan/LPS O-acetylase OafA/YrhL
MPSPTAPTAGRASSPASHSAPHRLERLDGIRALAVLLVFAAHTILPWHGWEGVHLFFVLSGFLITGILRRARHDKFFWRPFYIKRATRILPPLLLCLVIGYFLYSPPLWVLALYGLFAANIVQFTNHRLQGGIVVLWSLSVEEHFYLLWPLAVRFLHRRQLLILGAVLLVAEPIARLFAAMHYTDLNVVYMMTPFQLDGLVAGSMLSLLCEDEARRATLARVSRPAAALFLALYLSLTIFWKPFSLESNSLIFKSLGYTLIALTAAAIIAAVYLHPRSLLSRVLASWPMVFLGAISYGCYLFHPEMIDLARLLSQRIYGYPRGVLAMPVGICVAILLSWLSFHFYERPLILWGRRHAERFSGRKSPPEPAI